MSLSARDPRPSRQPAALVAIGLAALVAVTVTAWALGPWSALLLALIAAGAAFVWAFILLGSLGRYRTTTRSFFDGAGDAVLLLDPGTDRILDANRAACGLYGYARDEIIGMTARYLSDDRSGSETVTEQLLEVGETAQFDATQRRRDGSPVRVRIRATLTRVKGRLLVVSVNRDVTDEEWFGEELARRTRELQAVADNSEHLIVRLDTELRHRFVNRAVTEATGFTEEAFLGKTSADVGMAAEDIAVWTPALQTALHTGEPSEFEFGLTVGDERRTFTCVVVPEREACEGPIVSLLCVSRDVTDQRQVRGGPRRDTGRGQPAGPHPLPDHRRGGRHRRPEPRRLGQ